MTRNSGIQIGEAAGSTKKFVPRRVLVILGHFVLFFHQPAIQLGILILV